MTDFSPEALWRELDACPGAAARRRYCVAFSGGLDSTVLLTALSRLAHRLAPDALRAVHVHHGLHPAADAWAERCRARCAALGVPFTLLAEDARAAPGESPQARAREVRYQALRRALAHGEVLLTAHHVDDQLETALLQLLRGAGVAGLAAMPGEAAFGRGRHQRPLLRFERRALAAWAAAEGLTDWVEDPANADPRYARAHLRREVLPAIRAHWPGAATAVARGARHCAEAAALIDELAAMDAAACAAGEALEVAALRRLSPARCRNLVRWQARLLGLPVPDERRLATLLCQVFEAAADAQPQVRWPGVLALRHGGYLWLLDEARLPPPPATLPWPDPQRPLELGPGLGTLSLEPSSEGGLSPEALAAAPWRVTCRRGGERLRLPGRQGSRALKKLLHAAGVPPWWRARLPLVEIEGRLAAAGELWIDARWWAPPGATAWRLCWQGCVLPGHDAFRRALPARHARRR